MRNAREPIEVREILHEGEHLQRRERLLEAEGRRRLAGVEPRAAAHLATVQGRAERLQRQDPVPGHRAALDVREGQAADLDRPRAEGRIQVQSLEPVERQLHVLGGRGLGRLVGLGGQVAVEIDGIEPELRANPRHLAEADAGRAGEGRVVEQELQLVQVDLVGSRPVPGAERGLAQHRRVGRVRLRLAQALEQRARREFLHGDPPGERRGVHDA